jgi:hypothetical protein
MDSSNRGQEDLWRPCLYLSFNKSMICDIGDPSQRFHKCAANSVIFDVNQATGASCWHDLKLVVDNVGAFDAQKYVEIADVEDNRNKGSDDGGISPAINEQEIDGYLKVDTSTARPMSQPALPILFAEQNYSI